MESLYWLDRIQPSQANRVGEKALVLSQIWHTQSIVPGFVVSTARLRSFLERVGREEPLLADLADSALHIDVSDSEALRAIARRVRASILKTELPSEWLSEIGEAVRGWQTSSVIVRPSLVPPANRQQDFAGLLRSRVCSCESAALEFAIKWVWAERFRAASLFCWAKASASDSPSELALLIQPIRSARASGTVEIRGSEARVYSVWGLGHSAARGQVSPDCDIVSLKDIANGTEGSRRGIFTRQLGKKTLLYRLQQGTESPNAVEAENLQVELTSEVQQSSFCLSEAELNELLELTWNIAAKFPQLCYWEWTQFFEDERAAQPRLFAIVQGGLRCRIQTPIALQSAPWKANTFTASEPVAEEAAALLQGLPASPGRVSAVAESIANLSPSASIPPGRILVAKAIAPEWLPLLQEAAGIVAEQGGITSHAAIIARELGIPAIVGVRGATSTIKSGEQLSIDGTNGSIHRHEIADFADVAPQTESSVLQSRSDFPIATQLFLNLSQIRGLERAALLPIDGIGLLRSELAIVSMLDQQPLAWWLNGSRKNDFVKCLSEQILQFARAFFPRPVFYRSSDWRSRELSPDSGESTEGGNPILGRRGTLTYTLAPALFEAELAALARVQALGYANVRLILPFVRALEEVVFCRELIENIGLNQYPNFQLWIMAEVPSVSYMLPEYVKAGVQGISIGTNDLTQLLLGVDRERAELARLFDERHPAVLNTVRQLIEQSRSLGIPCSICGQAPVVYPEIIDLLVQWGISAISVEAGAVEKTYLAIARAEQRLMLEAARKGR
ncbi:putative PEP-binding protein [Oscillatoria sp. FACHB-1406]|uniref:putative PEP-binding protein n=1 Tax=Oscillatoria sp. FACHB-1406 TaxID=2692846 RepID=UPI001686168F|nr:hypothetical protein [Oscillatoria sp. FACHB-1406]